MNVTVGYGDVPRGFWAKILSKGGSRGHAQKFHYWWPASTCPVVRSEQPRMGSRRDGRPFKACQLCGGA